MPAAKVPTDKAVAIANALNANHAGLNPSSSVGGGKGTPSSCNLSYLSSSSANAVDLAMMVGFGRK